MKCTGPTPTTKSASILLVDSSVKINHESELDKIDIETTPARWLMLLLFSFLSFSNACIWISFSTIADITKERFAINDAQLNLLSVIYMIVYIPFVIVSSLIIERMNLGVGVWSGAILNCLGAWFRYLGSLLSIYPLLLTGQFICAMAQAFILGIPSKLSGVWFPFHERALATGVAVFANQFGNGAGLLLGPLLAHSPSQVVTYMLEQASVCTMIMCLILPFFSPKPDNPPSVAEAARTRTSPAEMWKSSWKDYKNLLASLPIMMLIISYGINVGVFYTFTTLLTPILQEYHKNASSQIGWCGFIFVAAGLAAAIFCSWFSGKTGKYKIVTITMYAGSLILMVIFILFGRTSGFSLLYVYMSLLGIFTTGILPVGFEYAAEITYPIAENVSSGLLNTSAQIWGILLIFLLQDYSPTIMLWTMGATLFLGFLLTFGIGNVLSRRILEENAAHPRNSFHE
eukprot:Sdes_comp19766_c1_seq1m11816